jgi:hypothetical protein
MLGGHGATMRFSREMDVCFCGNGLAFRDRAEKRAICLRTRDSEGPC